MSALQSNRALSNQTRALSNQQVRDAVNKIGGREVSRKELEAILLAALPPLNIEREARGREEVRGHMIFM